MFGKTSYNSLTKRQSTQEISFFIVMTRSWSSRNIQVKRKKKGHDLVSLAWFYSVSQAEHDV